MILVFSIIIIPTAYSQTDLELTLTSDKESYNRYDQIYISATTNIPDSDIIFALIHHPYVGEDIMNLSIHQSHFTDGIIDDFRLPPMNSNVNGTYTVIGVINDYDCERSAVTFQYGEIEDKELKDSEYIIVDENNNLKYDIEKLNTECEMEKEPKTTVATITLDKESYDIHDIIIITGNTNISGEYLYYTLISPYSNSTLSQGSLISDINFNFYHEIDIFNLVDVDSDRYVPISSGNYTIEIYFESNLITTIPFQITGKIYQPTLTLQKDKSEHYLDEPIIINGTVNDIDLSEDTTVNYDVYHGQEIIESENTTLQNDETFSFVINTNNELWYDHSGYIDVFVNIQNGTKSIPIYYHNTPNMSPEALYEMDMEQYDIIEQHDTLIEDQQSEIADVQSDIVKVKTDIDDVKTDMNETKSHIIDIQTDLVEQESDIIDIQTTVTQQQSIIDVIVTFLEDLGIIFSESETPGDNSTLLTELSDSSLPEGMNPEPQCGKGMELIDGYCFLIK